MATIRHDVVTFHDGWRYRTFRLAESNGKAIAFDATHALRAASREALFDALRELAIDGQLWGRH